MILSAFFYRGIIIFFFFTYVWICLRVWKERRIEDLKTLYLLLSMPIATSDAVK